MKKLFQRPALALFFVVAASHFVFGQQNGKPEETSSANSNQLARILGLDTKIGQLRTLRIPTSEIPAASRDEMPLRQDVLESIQAAALEVDSVLAEIANERGQLAELRFSLQSRRDRKVNRLNAAALLTGSRLGAAVSATQFTGLSSRTQNVGDGLGIGSGIASTIAQPARAVAWWHCRSGAQQLLPGSRNAVSAKRCRHR